MLQEGLRALHGKLDAFAEQRQGGEQLGVAVLQRLLSDEDGASAAGDTGWVLLSSVVVSVEG